jgi:hypothetical protein
MGDRQISTNYQNYDKIKKLREINKFSSTRGNVRHSHFDLKTKMSKNMHKLRVGWARSGNN